MRENSNDDMFMKYIKFVAAITPLEVDNDKGIISYGGEELDVPFPTIDLSKLISCRGIDLDCEARFETADKITELCNLSKTQRKHLLMAMVVKVKPKTIGEMPDVFPHY